MEIGDLVCGLQKQGKIGVLFRSSAQREEGQGLLQGAGGWKLNQPDVPSNSVEKKKVNCIERDLA